MFGNGEPAPEAARWIRHRGVLWRRLIDGAILLPPASENSLSLNESAALVWEVLAEPATTAEVAGLIAEAFGLSTVEATAAISPVLEHLADAGALECR